MVDKEQLAEDYSIGFPISPKAECGESYRTGLNDGFIDGFNQAEELYKQELQTATNLLIRLKNLHYQGDVAQTPLYKDIWEFLKDKEYSCSKNGIKREGESCTLNNNCIYPKCLK